jgi:hypothetical protein
MKGVVFTEFLEFVETEHGLDMVDAIITHCDLPSGGAYTSVATYDVGELFALIGELSRRLQVPVTPLVIEFGRHLFRFFARKKSVALVHFKSAEQLLEAVEDQIHVEVRKLYPDAELPSIRFYRVSETQSKVVYHSARPMADLAEGLILEAIVHFGDPLDVVRRDTGLRDGTTAEFELNRK